jgi:hypothetical protein
MKVVHGEECVDFPTTKKVQDCNMCTVKVMGLVSWNVKGVVYSELMPTNTTVNSGIV